MKQPSLRRHGNWELTRVIVKEEAMTLDPVLAWQDRTARVQVSVTYKDDNGVSYAATRIIKMRIRREEQQ